MALTRCIIPLTLLSSCQAPSDYRYVGVESQPLTEMAASYKPSTGYVRTPDMAAKIAEIYGLEYYGQQTIDQQRPLLVSKAGTIWVVKGSFPNDPNLKGGVFEIRISADTGEVLGMIHGK
jgi:hypothetical protein